MKTLDEQRFLFLELISEAPLSMSCEPVILVARQHGLLATREQDKQSEDKQIIRNHDLVNEAIGAWGKKVQEASLNGNLAYEPQLHSILYRWVQLPGSSYKKAWGFVDALCSTDDGLRAFCLPLCGGIDHEVRHANAIRDRLGPASAPVKFLRCHFFSVRAFETAKVDRFELIELWESSAKIFADEQYVKLIWNLQELVDRLQKSSDLASRCHDLIEFLQDPRIVEMHSNFQKVADGIPR